MLRLLAASVGLCVCALAQESVLAVYLHQSDHLPPAVLQSLQSETERVLRPLDSDVVWHDTTRPREDAGRLVVVRFEGSCSFADYTRARDAASLKGAALASTSITNGRVQPFVFMHCSRLRDLIAPVVVGLKPPDREEALGKAAGRVLAHEIYHVLSGERKHSHSGVAADCVSTRQLLAPRFDLDEISVAQMKTVRPEPIVSFDEPQADYSQPSGR